MKKHIKDFVCRGMLYAWLGPVILAIIWICLKKANVVSVLTVQEVAFGIVTMTVMGFIAAGVSIVYQIENLPLAFAGLIQATVLYLDFLGFYLLNGWIPLNKIWIFTLIFIIIFVAIWFSIYIPIRIKISKMNKMIHQ